MEQRPDLTCAVDADSFRGYYYLKEELVDFCRKEGLQTTGGKLQLTERIAFYLQSGIKTTTVYKTVKPRKTDAITLETLIESPFVCSEKHRAFFKERIGGGFTFTVSFQKWLKSNAGKTYQEAVEAYTQCLQEKKKNQTSIDRQFEYNTYIRAFFADNAGKTLQDAIQCWNHCKSKKGSHVYAKSDLAALENS